MAEGEEAEPNIWYPHLSQRLADSPDRRVQPFLHSTDDDSPHSAFMHVFDPIPLPLEPPDIAPGVRDWTAAYLLQGSNRVNPARS